MRKRSPLLYLIILVSLAPFFNVARAQVDAGDQDLRKEVVSARELISQGKYEAASERLGELSRKYTDSPAGDFYQAVTLIWKSYVDAPKLDAGSRAFDSATESLLMSAIKKAEATRARPDKSKEEEIEALYYLGSAQAIRSRLSLYQNHAIPAAQLARASQDSFAALLKLDPNYEDGYYAPGSIYYRVGLLTDSPLGRVATSMLGAKSLPTGDRARGLDYLKRAAEKGAVTSVDAKLALLEIYTFNESRFDQALVIARELQSKYPDNQTFARYLLRIYSGLKDRAKLAQMARQVLAQVKAGKPNFGPFMKAEAGRYLAEASKR
jgi:predicted Zn-dependent protease